MIDLRFMIVGVIAGIAFVEVIIRLGTLHHLSTLTGIVRKASNVVASNQISDHWKEIAVPAYAKNILRMVIIASVHLLLAVAIYSVFVVIVASLWANADIGITTFTNLMLNVGAVAGGVVYTLIRQRVAR
jgi:hypothetical protein